MSYAVWLGFVLLSVFVWELQVHLKRLNQRHEDTLNLILAILHEYHDASIVWDGDHWQIEGESE